jgi:hypothetical protein
LNYDIIPTCDILFILVPGGSGSQKTIRRCRT